MCCVLYVPVGVLLRVLLRNKNMRFAEMKKKHLEEDLFSRFTENMVLIENLIDSSTYTFPFLSHSVNVLLSTSVGEVRIFPVHIGKI